MSDADVEELAAGLRALGEAARRLEASDVREVVGVVVDEIEACATRLTLPTGETPPYCNAGGYVYFIQCDEPRRSIKIGSTRDLERRLRTLRVSTPFEMRLVGYYWTDQPEVGERFLHMLHAADRIRGEWFLPSRAVVDSIRSATFRSKREPARREEVRR